jgi:hypothetical protein
MKANAIHRGLTHLFVTGAILGTQRTLGRWQTRHKVGSPARFLEVRDEAVTGREIAWSATETELVAELERFLEERIHGGAKPSSRERAGAAHPRAVRLLFRRPGSLDDHVLFRMKEWPACDT